MRGIDEAFSFRYFDTTHSLLVINPKRRKRNGSPREAYWDHYYPGYSFAFTKKIIESDRLDKSSIILDPWNGSGTSTYAASLSGFRSIGIDLNPVMKIIAKARQATASDARVAIKSLQSLRCMGGEMAGIFDPLGVWFDEKAVLILRAAESGILGDKRYPSTDEKIDSLDVPRCLMYVALFNTVREYLKPFTPSNPTWIKKPARDAEKVSIDPKTFETEYETLLRHTLESISRLKRNELSEPPELIIGSSSKMPFEDESVDLVLTSPPYCTRIDYGVATLPELSIVSVDGKEEINAIRRRLMGATTVPREACAITKACGRICAEFMEQVRNHPSRASGTYYYKNFGQYFTALGGSISEVARVLKKNRRTIFVVQNSFYKEIHCDLSGILTEMADLSGLSLVERKDFKIKNNMANVNTKSRPYRSVNTALESVLTLER